MIGRAFWRSLVILGVIVAGALGVFFWDSWRSERSVVDQTPLDPPETRKAPLESIPRMAFTDVTSAAGVHFTHFNGATGEKLLPETMGAGVAILDFNGDGLQDLLFVNGTDWPWTRPEARRSPPPTAALYQNMGGGRFADVTTGSGLDRPFYGTGVAAGDYDNDGRVDLFLSGVGGMRLFHNEGGGRFRDVTTEAGLGCGPEDWGTSAAFLDYDNDGKLDLFLCQYVRWSREIDIAVNYRLVGVGRAYGPPSNFPGAQPRLYHNEGGGRFLDVSAASGIQVTNRATGLPMAKSLGVAPVDLDRDGWIDLVVANDTVQNFVFHNERNGRFREVGATSGIAFDSYGGIRGAMGIDAARVQEEDQLSIAIGNFANEMTALYVCARAAAEKKVSILADGGITKSGDIVKALTLANAVICGGVLAGCAEAPGEILEIGGKLYKQYRGMGSLAAMKAGSAARYGHATADATRKVAAEGVEALKEVAGPLERTLAPLIGGIFTSFVLELLIYPPIYQLWKWHSEVKPEMESPVPVLSENLERGV